MTTITGNQIPRFQLAVWRGAIKLEKVGMKRRGPSCKSIACQHFGMKKSSTHDEVLERIQQELDLTS